MTLRNEWSWEYLLDRSLPLCMILALAILSISGVGDVRRTSLVGLFLCGTGLMRDVAKADLKILLPLLIYDLAALISSYASYGNIVNGYGAMHALLPVLYLLTACLDAEEQRFLRIGCTVWVGFIAASGVAGFTVRAAFDGWAVRLSGMIGNPNAMGIFLVVGWFVWLACQDEEPKPWLFPLEPVLLIALALTLSMGSFVSMAAGVVVLAAEKKQSASWRETALYLCRILSRASLGMGTGILIYLTAARTSIPWTCLFLVAYGIAAALCWRSFCRFLEVYPKMACLLTVLGVLVAASAVLVRPSTVDTFAERLEMMKSGLHYLTVSPLFGVGPLQWRMLDLNDGGKYFNTWHIHNIPIHIGVEMGWIAMGAVIFVGVRAFQKKKSPYRKAGTGAFLLHNLIDTSFFYLGITSLALLAAGEPDSGGRTVRGVALKAFFVLFAGLFVFSLFCMG